MHISPVLPLSFLHILNLNILLWKNPLRRYRPLPLHMLKIFSQDHLYKFPPCSLFFLSSLPSFTSPLSFLPINLLHLSPVHYLTQYQTFLCDVTPFFSFIYSCNSLSCSNLIPLSLSGSGTFFNIHPSICPPRDGFIHLSIHPLSYKANQPVDHPATGVWLVAKPGEQIQDTQTEKQRRNRIFLTWAHSMEARDRANQGEREIKIKNRYAYSVWSSVCISGGIRT